MALQVKIPKEILEHKDKFLFGLTVRQLICVCIPGIVAAGSYYLMYVYQLDKDLITNLISFFCLPFIAFGFFEPRGYKLEEYFKIIYNHRYAPRKKYYATALTTDEILKPYITPPKAKKVKKERLSELKDVEVIINLKQIRKENKRNYRAAKKALRLAIKAEKKNRKLATTVPQTQEPPISIVTPIPVNVEPIVIEKEIPLKSTKPKKLKNPLPKPELSEFPLELLDSPVAVMARTIIKPPDEPLIDNLQEEIPIILEPTVPIREPTPTDAQDDISIFIPQINISDNLPQKKDEHLNEKERFSFKSKKIKDKQPKRVIQLR